jgi:hypothetical protein
VTKASHSINTGLEQSSKLLIQYETPSLLYNIIFLPSSMLVILLIKSHLLLVFTPLPSPDFAFSTVLTFSSPLVVTLINSQTPIMYSFYLDAQVRAGSRLEKYNRIDVKSSLKAREDCGCATTNIIVYCRQFIDIYTSQ